MDRDGSRSVELLVPESPMLEDTYLTPEMRSAEAGPSKLSRTQMKGGANVRRPSIPSPAPAPLLDFSPSTILTRLEEERSHSDAGTSLRISLILQHALTYAIEHCDVDLLNWLLSLGGEWAQTLNEIAEEMEGEDSWGVVGMSIAASSGRQEREECVRAIVTRWGLESGIRRGKDQAGWTPLHLAALVSTPPLISYLLTRGASPKAQNDKGLTPLDLVSGMETRLEAATLLEQATSTGPSRSATPPLDRPPLSEARVAMLQKRRSRLAEATRRQEEQEKCGKMQKEKEDWVRGLLKVVDVDPALLFPPKKPRQSGALDLEEGEDGDIENHDPGEDLEISSPSRIDDTSLVWGTLQLPHILDTFISSYRPVCQPVSGRALPANALYLYSRFAYYHCDESWLDELLISALDRIEEAVYKDVDNLAFLAFWAYNTTLLLYLIRCDQALAEAAEKLIVQLEELANAIHVFIIRIAERKVDAVLDDALLDYETLEDFDDVRFEGEWTLFRSFGTKKQRTSVVPKAASVFANGVAQLPEPASPGILETLKGKMDGSSTFKVPRTQASLQDLRAATLDTAHNAIFGASKASPRSVTEILSAVLVVLQLYEVNPVITIQTFSQIFFWIACELFNRILSRKKYLCRSKAVQIRMNITAVEDWVRSHGLPVRTVTQHFEPVTQLLQWLQCQSALSNFDHLIGTLQNMRSINPMQMRRAVRDYRFEVSEGRMTDECLQYLAQMQKDWERRRVQMSVETIKQGTKRQSSNDDLDDPAVYYGYRVVEPPTTIDALFDTLMSLADFVPQSAPEPLGELLDSRFMLPFHLPRDPSFLIATPPPDAAYQIAFPPGTWAADGTRSSRPPSRSSFVSAKPLGWSLPNPHRIRDLPPDFFTWLKERDAERRHRREAIKPPTELHRAPSNPLGQSTSINIPPRISTDSVSPKLPSLSEDDSTPVAISASAPTFPSAGLQTSASIDQLREKMQTSFSTSPPQETRSNSYELASRTPSKASFFATSPTSSSHSGMTSSSSVDSVGKKRWWKLGRKTSQLDLNESEMTGLPRRRREDSVDTVRAGLPAESRSGTITPMRSP